MHRRIGIVVWRSTGVSGGERENDKRSAMRHQVTNMSKVACGMTNHETAQRAIRFDSARLAGWVKLVSIVLIVVGLLVMAAALPVARGVEWLEGWLAGLGFWGPLAFAIIYIVAAVLFVPGGALTILAGALFGLLWGTITVSLASTTAAAVAFLIGRYVARDAVRRQTAKYPKFAAVDRAIAEGGWRIVLMLRLVPVFPFSTGNYLLGLTPVRFWGYVLASWVGMLPGTFIYVYLGNVGRLTADAVARGEATGMDPLQWALTIGGGIVAIGGIIYMTRLVRRRLAAQTELETAPQEEGTVDTMQHEQAASTRRPWVGASVAATLAVLVLVAAACAQFAGGWITGLFGPPRVAMAEAYEEKPGGPTFDHGRFAVVLEAYVNDNGGVDYEGLAENPDELLAYNASLAEAPWDELGRNQRLALLLNAYNSFTLQLMIEFWNDG